MINPDIEAFLGIFPYNIRAEIAEQTEGLLEVVLDLERPVELRFIKGYKHLNDTIVTSDTLDSVERLVSEFGADNRAGISGTLHRISRIVNRAGRTVGLTCRVGRPFDGYIQLIKDIVDDGFSVLVIGRPGSGKTSLVRGAARYLSDHEKRVVIVDTSNEIAGDGDVPHPAVGTSRRLQVPAKKPQHDVMIEAVENHYPEIIIIDEISTIQEALSCMTIAQRGVQLIATAHGRTLEDLIKNPPISKLIGGITSVTLSDEESKNRGTQKTVLEREMSPTFTKVVELLSFDQIAVYPNVAEAIDAILSGDVVVPERRLAFDGGMNIIQDYKIRPHKNGNGAMRQMEILEQVSSVMKVGKKKK
jgi:stage III sporulation protein SpoIIIAA